MTTYGERLAQAMRFANKERKDLATAIKKSTQAVGSVINGKTNAFTAENNANAARFLKVNASWLATGKGNMLPCAAPESPLPSLTAVKIITLEQALEIVASAILLSDELTLDQVRPLLMRLVDEPPRAPEIVPRIAVLLGAAGAAPSTETNAFAGGPIHNESERAV